jgi:tetratricopeptide (TPR) repeat protein
VELEVAEALTAAREALLREPDSGKAWGRLADHYFAHDFTAEAAQCYARAEELDPESFLWSYRQGWCLMKDRPDLAAAPFERSLRALDTYAPAHAIYASVLVRLGRSDEALEHYSRASALDPKDPEPETGLGLIFLARGEYEQARKHLEAALARNERHAEAHVALSQAYLALGLDKKAQRHAEFSRTLPRPRRQFDSFATPSLPPTGSRARTRLGQQLEAQGHPEPAAEQFRLAIRSNPSYYPARRSLASLLAARGRRDEAIELLREMERANPSFERVKRDLAKLLDPEGGLEPEEEAEE